MLKVTPLVMLLICLSLEGSSALPAIRTMDSNHHGDTGGGEPHPTTTDIRWMACLHRQGGGRAVAGLEGAYEVCQCRCVQ